MSVLQVNRRIRIPLEAFEFTYARSSGPGGQNVNKVNSKAILRWPVLATPHLPPDVRARFLARYANRITAEGDLVLQSQRYRDQARNVDDCLEKLRSMLADVAQPPVRRKATKVPRSVIEQRLKQKRQTGQRKRLRRQPPRDE
jgi:ribosome-associated protein